ncbi:MAG: dihydropteroate synthase [Chitinophagaceae bacterium]|nr:dihydropteroate synthase [Chitinophagaceae bacterium]
MYTLNCKGRLLVIDKPLVMGIINVTPDSFYAGSRQEHITAVLQQAERMLTDGAALLDIGGQSTRPSSTLLSAEEELQRVLPAIEAVHQQFPAAFISVDTFYSRVAKEAVAAGACLVNDVSGGSMDEQMVTTVAALQVPYVLMHMKGTPQTMQQLAVYDNVTTEVLDFFIQKTDDLRRQGITDIIIDPGFGFAKTATHNFELLRHLEAFSILPCPLLLGVSRKSFIYKTLRITPAEALNGTTVIHTAGLLKGASILRVHDVKEAVEAVKLTAML